MPRRGGAGGGSPHRVRHRIAVLPAWSKAVARSRNRCGTTLAAACSGASDDIRTVSAVRFAFRPILSPLATPTLYAGVLFLCTLPSTVQSSIAFTAIAKGNVPAAICSASASSIIGIFVTPLVAGLVLSNHRGAASGWDAVGQITLQLFVPFVCGQLLQPFIGGWIGRHDGIVGAVDQGSILLIVYSAFSAAVSEGLWHQVSPTALAGLVVADSILLCVALITTGFLGKWLGFDRADRVAIIFCGSKKSLSQGDHGQSYLCFPRDGCSDPPADGLPSHSTDGLRGAGPAMGSSCRALCTRLARRQVR